MHGKRDVLLILLFAYGAASLFHHIHNAHYLAEYPNMPSWLTPAGVYAAWLGVNAVGFAGYILLCWRYRLAGLVLLGVYGMLGLYGLAHYAVAPMSSHTMTMHLTIGLEAVTAALLLIAVAFQIARRRHTSETHE